MSLLLEALKKAEKAKEEAQRRARADSGSEAEKAELRLEGEPALAPQAERKPLLTRDKLPEISEPLEIVTEDLETPHAARRPDTTRKPNRQDRQNGQGTRRVLLCPFCPICPFCPLVSTPARSTSPPAHHAAPATIFPSPAPARPRRQVRAK